MGYAAGASPRMLPVTIPANATPGSVVRVVDPMTNRMIEFVVPPNAYPGSVINVNVDNYQQAPVVYQQAPQPAVMGAPTTVIVKERRDNNNAADSCMGTLAACCLVCACCELMSLAR